MSHDGPEGMEACLRMVTALSRGDGRAALEHRREALDESQDRPFLRARVQAWTAQAHLMLGELNEAGEFAVLALHKARTLGDEDGVTQLAALIEQIDLAKASGEGRGPGVQPLPWPQGKGPLQLALAALRAGDHETAAMRAHEALDSATTAKDRVTALLALARVPAQAERAVRQAAQVADDSNDAGLVTAVAKAARELCVDLGTRVL